MKVNIKKFFMSVLFRKNPVDDVLHCCLDKLGKFLIHVQTFHLF